MFFYLLYLPDLPLPRDVSFLCLTKALGYLSPLQSAYLLSPFFRRQDNNIRYLGIGRLWVREIFIPLYLGYAIRIRVSYKKTGF